MQLTRFAWIAAIAVATFTGGCAGLQRAATDPDYDKTRRGAAIGAAVGAVAGLLTKGDKLDNALIGAAVGGLAGGAVGNYQDRQEARLRQELAGSGVDVVRQGNNITLDMPGSVTFATDSADLNARFFGVLDRVGQTLAEYDQTVVEVAGHTDSTGSRGYNLQLSERRAQTVASYLSSRGVASRRLLTVGAGPDHPVASNSTADGRQQNRRVEITIVPVERRSAG